MAGRSGGGGDEAVVEGVRAEEEKVGVERHDSVRVEDGKSQIKSETEKRGFGSQYLTN